MSSGVIVLIAIAVVVGALVPLQAGVNATMAAAGGHPLLAAVVNTGVATAVLLGVILALRVPLPFTRAVASAPWYAWTGGICGAALVLSAIMVAPRLGAASYVSAMILGTMAASLLVDHFGLLVFSEHPLSGLRLLGGALVVAGMVMVNRF